MTVFTRCVIAGSEKKATLVLPSQDPLSNHLATLAQLVQEPNPESDLWALVLSTGESINCAQSLADQNILDGTVLHLVRARDIPPEPEVNDISDFVADNHTSTFTVKTVAHRRLIATMVTGLLFVIIGAGLHQVTPPWVFLATGGAATAVGFACGLFRFRHATRLALSIAVAMVATACLMFAQQGIALTTVMWILLASVWLIIGIVLGAGERRIAPVLGAIIGVSLGVGGWATQKLGLSTAESSAIIATLGFIALALLPRAALSISGLTRSDDQRVSGKATERPKILKNIADAYEGLQWAVSAIAAVFILTIPGLLLSDTVWFVALGCILSMAVLLRTRVFPLVLSSWLLWIAVIAGAGLSTAWLAWSGVHSGSWLVVGGIAVALTASILLALMQPAAHTAAQLRRQGDQLESLLVVALVPVLLGGFGLYTALLGMFQ